MRKIKILFGLTISFVTIISVHLFIQIIYYEFFIKVHTIHLENSFFGKSSLLIQHGISFIVLLGLIYVCLAFYNILKNGYFNIKTSKSFRLAGLFLCFAAISDIIKVLFNITTVAHDRIGYLTNIITTDGLLLFVSFGIFIIAEIIKNGTLLKQENDLTI